MGYDCVDNDGGGGNDYDEDDAVDCDDNDDPTPAPDLKTTCFGHLEKGSWDGKHHFEYNSQLGRRIDTSAPTNAHATFH
jgi:hypothetical protein